LGGHPERLALSAARACRLGAQGIDLNFGCPAPTVNQHDGGAAILRYPKRIQEIVSTVRKAVPPEIPVSAKLRLGWECVEDIYVNAEQAVLGGASWLTIHARTKMQGYAPPAYWSTLGEVRRRLGSGSAASGGSGSGSGSGPGSGVPIVANGEIWSLEDFLRCQEETGCEHFMLGRGALGDPSLVHQIARQLGIDCPEPLEEEEVPYSSNPRHWEPILRRFSEISEPICQDSQGSQYTSRRIKQWLRFAGMKRPLPWFDAIKRTQNLGELFAALKASGEPSGKVSGEASGAPIETVFETEKK